jgi:hypothetical protein
MSEGAEQTVRGPLQRVAFVAERDPWSVTLTIGQEGADPRDVQAVAPFAFTLDGSPVCLPALLLALIGGRHEATAHLPRQNSYESCRRVDFTTVPPETNQGEP